MKRKKREEYKNVALLEVYTLVILLFISVFGLVIIGYISWQNANHIGEEMAESYCLAEEYNFNVYKNFLEIGTNYMDMMEREGFSHEQKDENIKEYFTEIQSVFKTGDIEPYAVIDDSFIFGESFFNRSKENERAENINIDKEHLKQQQWYTKALEGDGQVIVTEAYQDTVYGRMVMTIAKKCDNSSNILAIDVLEESFSGYLNRQELPKGSVCYIYDFTGRLFFSDRQSDKIDQSSPAYKEYTEELFDEVKDAEEEGEPLYINDLRGKKQGIYFRKNASGGYCVLTVPRNGLMTTYGVTYICYVLIFLVVMGIIAYVWRDTYKKRFERERLDETVQVLGSSYYALYRVNIKNETYECIKGREFLKEKDFSNTGTYKDLLKIFENYIHEDAIEEFLESFSLENMRNRIEDKTESFGGDFQRDFDGEYKWVNIRMLYEPAMSKNEVVLCFRQFDDEKQKKMRYIATLQEALEAAQKSENLQKKFFANMSHDMRTPLNGIIGISEIAEKYVNEPEKMKDYLSKINFSGKQLLSLINDILEISRLENGIELENNQFRLRETIEKCVTVFAMQAKQQNKKLIQDYYISDDLVYGDAMRLIQILNNLVSNAMKYTASGDSITVKVKQLGKTKHTKYQIMVCDTGAGMSQSFVRRIFNPYEREKRFSSEVEGTGLGMAIVKSLVSQMGGEITVESKLNKGTNFMLVLPLRAVEENAQEKEAENQEEYSLDGKKILLAEDYEMNMEIATELLEMEGVSVVKAWNGKEALERFKESEENEFDAILMDMQMPVMDGCTAAVKIRELSRTDAKEIPIIALTANAYAENIASTMNAGMNAHIVKPIDTELLRETLGKLIAEKSGGGYNGERNLQLHEIKQ